jgi:carbonic anhydrase
MDHLLEGYRRFRAGVWPTERDRYETLSVNGQHPDTMVLTCADSRLDPQTIFGAGPGELFVVRNIAGISPPYEPDEHHHGTSAALEYGVRVLKVRQILVLGHGQCGGVQAMVQGVPAEAGDFVGRWMKLAESVMQRKPKEQTDDVLRHYENEVVRLTLENLMTFPWIAEAVKGGRLTLRGGWFGVRHGVLAMLDGDRFVPVD